MSEASDLVAKSKIGAIIAKSKPAERTVKICVDGEIAEQLETATGDLKRLRQASSSMASPEIAAKVSEIRDLESQADESTFEFLIRSVGHKAWKRIGREHPPPEGDTEGWLYDPETFPVAALAASCVDPEMTEDEADQLVETLSEGQWLKLWNAVLTVNAGDDLIPKSGLGTAGAPTTASLSTTAGQEESPSPSS